MSNPGNGCPAGLIELKNSLKRELQGEDQGHMRYLDGSIKLLHYGEKTLAGELREVATQELMHRHILEGIIDNIDEHCNKGN